jgi:LacI family transcriptional regulator
LPLLPEYRENPRWQGYSAAMRAAGLDAVQPVWFDSDKAQDRGEIARFMKNIKPYTALFLHHDTFAATVLATLHRAGIHVPNDFSLISYDGAPLAEALDLTTLTLPMEQVAVRVAEIFKHSKKGSVFKPGTEVFEAKLTIRGSVASV